MFGTTVWKTVTDVRWQKEKEKMENNVFEREYVTVSGSVGVCMCWCVSDQPKRETKKRNENETKDGRKLQNRYITNKMCMFFRMHGVGIRRISVLSLLHFEYGEYTVRWTWITLALWKTQFDWNGKENASISFQLFCLSLCDPVATVGFVASFIFECVHFENG